MFKITVGYNNQNYTKNITLNFIKDNSLINNVDSIINNNFEIYPP